MNELIINYGLPILGVLVTAIAQWFVTHNYNKYKKVKNHGNLTGADVAMKILKKHNITDIKVSSGAGFIVVLMGKIMTMPGLAKNSAYLNMDIDNNLQIKGLF